MISLPTYYRGAGILFSASDSTGTKRILLGKRLWSPYRGHWTVPGGKMDPADRGNFRITAARECFEETVGIRSLDSLREMLLHRLREAPESRIHVPFVFDFRVFSVGLSFIPDLRLWPNQLNLENEFDGFCWFDARRLPRPLHPGMTAILRS